MKKINSLKLVNLSKSELGKNEMNSLAGGESCCVCSCSMHNSSDNASANLTYGYHGSGGSRVMSK